MIVPQAVLDEVLAGEWGDPSLELVPQAVGDWLRVVPTPPVHSSIRADRLDPGEISVLSVALENPGWEAVLDDQAARREAARLGIPCIGTVGLLLTGHRRGTVPSVRAALETLRDAGMYISDHLFQIALDQAGESR